MTDKWKNWPARGYIIHHDIIFTEMAQVVWRRAGVVHPLTIGLFTFVSDTRVTVRHNTTSNTWCLTLGDVQLPDAGTYQCQINSKDDQTNFYDVHLHVVSEYTARQLYKNISMRFLFPVKDGKLSTGVSATFDASCYG